MEVDSEPPAVGVGEGWIVDAVDPAEGFLGVPGHADFAVGVSSFEEAPQAAVPAVVEAFVGGGQQPAYPIQGIPFPAPVPEGFLLGAAADLVEAFVGQPHYMERISDLAGVGQHSVVGRPVRARQDPSPPNGSVPTSLSAAPEATKQRS